MKKRLLFCLVPIALLMADIRPSANGPVTLAIGSPAPDFNLRSVNGKMYNLASFKNAQILVVVFTCNHCPTAQAYEDRIIRMTADYADKGVAVVAIMPNDPKSLRLDELDFSDIGDSYAEMKIRAKEKNFNFPYLYDGDEETASRAYGPVATPHVFIFDKERKLRYTGRVDDTESPFKTPRTEDARNAIDALLNNKEVPVKTTKVFGCSIKWSEKRSLVQKALENWEKEPVQLKMIDEADTRALLKNPSGHLRLITVWTTRSEQADANFADFITINRMYRDRDFEFIGICADDPANEPRVLQFLRRKYASNTNYLFKSHNKKRLEAAIDPSWPGALPYSLLVEPGGKIVYAKQGRIDPAAWKKMIVNNHLIGKYP